jgi:hypothetical protein
LTLMKTGPMIQNPGRVLYYAFTVWLLSQVMDSEMGNVVNVNVTMDNENNPEQVSTSQVVKVNIGNKDHMDVVNADNPGQVLQNQVGNNGKMDNLEQALFSLEDLNAVDTDCRH